LRDLQWCHSLLSNPGSRVARSAHSETLMLRLGDGIGVGAGGTLGWLGTFVFATHPLKIWMGKRMPIVHVELEVTHVDSISWKVRLQSCARMSRVVVFGIMSVARNEWKRKQDATSSNTKVRQQIEHIHQNRKRKFSAATIARRRSKADDAIVMLVKKSDGDLP
jgi:hypothetical protein